ncbi:MAG: YfcE family phosphodiesterase [Promethearchaeota archaeon]
MKTMGIISDTRMKEKGTTLPGRVLEAFNKVDMILHAGNICTEGVLEELETIAPVVAVLGPLDNPRDFKRNLKKSEIIDFDGYRVGLINEKPPLDFIKENNIQILVTGNTCIPKIEESRELRLSVNPGTPFKRYSPKNLNGTVILLKNSSKLLFSYVIKL